MSYYVNDTVKTMKPPKPGRPFQVNDIVRLIRGWTPMTVAHISDGGILTAYYGIYDFDPVGDPDPPNVFTGHYRRPISGWAWWDGEIIPGRNMPMPRRFTVNSRSSMDVGHLTGYTSSGLLILEFANNQIETFAENEVTEVVQFTFKTRQINNNNQITQWSFMDPMKRVRVDDLLWSDTDGLVRVIEIDTRANRTRNFLGKRIPLEEI